MTNHVTAHPGIPCFARRETAGNSHVSLSAPPHTPLRGRSKAPRADTCFAQRETNVPIGLIRRDSEIPELVRAGLRVHIVEGLPRITEETASGMEMAQVRHYMAHPVPCRVCGAWIPEGAWFWFDQVPYRTYGYVHRVLCDGCYDAMRPRRRRTRKWYRIREAIRARIGEESCDG